MIDGLPKNTPFVRPSSSLPEIILFFAGISCAFFKERVYFNDYNDI